MKILLTLLIFFVYQHSVFGQMTENAVIRYDDLQHPELGSYGMVAAQNRLSAEAGASILEAGGNAIDAAIATGFSLAVTLPRAGNLGGGGFMLIHNATTGEDLGVDYREMAPQSATRDMYLDKNGNVDTNLSRFSHLAAGVPGTVSGFFAVHERFGKLKWSVLLQPAIDQARNGVVITHHQAEFLKKRQSRLCKNDAACAYFYKSDGTAYKAGELFIQKDLAKSLQLIADNGPDAFYKGEIAKLIIDEMKRHGGLIDAASLSAYKPIFRDVVEGTYRGFKVVSMPPPSSGGVHILQMLNILENFPVKDLGAGSADNIHLLAEVARYAFADRSKHLGDPDYYDVPIEWLIGKTYAEQLAKLIDMKKARDSNDVLPGVIPIYESEDTTHFSVIDKDGNAVSNTYTLNFSFGSGIAVPGTGFLLNNEMDDFSSKPGTMNAFGLLGGEANSIKAGKRPLSSMTPTMVFKNGQLFFATGSPGGSRIITTVLQIIVNIIDHNMNLAEATIAPRMHHQWFPDIISLESGFSPDSIHILKSRGHNIKSARGSIGNAQSVGFQNSLFLGASDTRRPGAGSVAPSN